MEITAVQYLMSVVGLAIYVYLLWIGYKRSLLGHHPFFYGFVGWCLVRDVARWIALLQWGYNDTTYYHIYNIAAIPTPIAQIFLLLEIYQRVKSRNDVRHWLVLVLFSCLMSVYSLRQQEVNFYLVFNNVSLYFQVLFCLLVHVQLHGNRQVYLGRNYAGILFGLSLMIALQSFNYGLRLFESLSTSYFVHLSQFLSFIPWVAYIAWMRKLDLPRPIEPELIEEIEAVEANFKRAVRCLR